VDDRPLPRRLVLDTNVWLDWLVFGDARVAMVANAVNSGRAVVVIDAACREELVRVLAYPLGRHTLDAGQRARCLAECDRIAKVSPLQPQEQLALPRCSDPDDQKFLELARDARADALVTKDRALLVLARRRHPTLPFLVLRPEQLAERLGLAAPACPG
jgi:putative PIN family toxin of toxin-antitoxin system